MANFIDYVVEASKNKKLAKEFNEMLKKSTPPQLFQWFKSKGFTISEEECKKLIENKDTVKTLGALKGY